jgi:hypothetical protein
MKNIVPFEQEDLFPLMATLTCPLTIKCENCANFKHCIAPYEKSDPIESVINNFKRIHNLC